MKFHRINTDAQAFGAQAFGGQAFRRGASALAIAAAAGLAAPALAQTAQGDAAQQGGEQTEAVDPDEILVTGRRAALESADRRKRNSETIIDSVVADDAGRLPDNSITEVLQRVSGVAIVRFAALGNPDSFSVEGSGIQVRGLSGVASRLNGREIFGANNGRALLWGDVTPELMQAVDVYKSSTADLIEGGTGGQIDLRTKMPFDYSGFAVAANANLSVGSKAKVGDYTGSILVSDRFVTPIGEFGILADIAYSQLTSQSDFFRTEPYIRTRISGNDYFIPAGYTFGRDDFQRKRTGIYGAIQWRPHHDFTLAGTFFQSRYQNESSGRGSFVTSENLALNPATSEFDDIGGLLFSDSLYDRNQATGAPTGGLLYSGGGAGAGTSETVTRDYALNFDYRPAGTGFAVRGAIQHVDSRADVDRYDMFRDVSFPTVFGLDLRGKLPQILVPANAQTRFNDKTNYIFTATQPHSERNAGALYSGNVDVEYTFPDDGFFRSIKVGGRYAERTERDLSNGYNWSALGRGWNGSPQLTYANARPGDVELYTFDDFFGGGVTPPGQLFYPTNDVLFRADRVADHTPTPAGFCPVTTTPAACASSGPTPTGYGGAGFRAPGFILPNDQTDYRTNTYAGYALVRFGREPEAGAIGYSGNVGVRVVKTENSSVGNFTQGLSNFIRNGVLTSLAERATILEGGSSFTKILPSVNLQVNPSDDFKVRFGYNITMDNASFFALRAQGSLGVSTVTVQGAPQGTPATFRSFTASSGNPELRPAVSNNLDLSIEWYPKRGTTFHAAGFYKRIKDLPVYTSQLRDFEVFFTAPTVTSSIEQAEVLDVANASEAAIVKGVEVGGRTFFDMLPGFLGGFGVEANYTFIDSSNPGDQYSDIDGVIRRDLPLQGLSQHNFNATLLFEKNPVSARLAYSWRSRYLQTTTGNGTNGDYLFYPRPSAPAGAQLIDISLPIYGDAYGTLDAGVRFRVTKNFSFSIEGTNLLNATARTLMGGYPDDKLYVRSWFQSDQRLTTSVSLAF